MERVSRERGVFSVHSLNSVVRKVCFVGAAVGLVSLSAASGSTNQAKQMSSSQMAAIKRGLAANHQAFVRNSGQWDAKGLYRAQSDGLDYWLTKNGVTFNYY